MTEEERDKLFYASRSMKGKVDNKDTRKRLKNAQAGMTSEKLQRKYRKQWYHRGLGDVLVDGIVWVLDGLLFGGGKNK